MIEISDSVKDQLQDILKKNPGKYLRLTVEGDGCAGPYFNLSLDEAGDSEVIARVNGIDVLLSDHVKKVSETATIKIFMNHIGEEGLT